MQATITHYKSKFTVKVEFNKALWDFFKRIPSRRWEASKEIWSFDSEALTGVVDYFKMHNYTVTQIDKTASALLFVVNKSMYLLFDFDSEVKEQFEKRFPEADYKKENNEWTMPSYNYTHLVEFLKENKISYVYVNQTIKFYMSYLADKFRQEEEEDDDKENRPPGVLLTVAAAKKCRTHNDDNEDDDNDDRDHNDGRMPKSSAAAAASAKSAAKKKRFD
jgi:hypothetical protein